VCARISPIFSIHPDHVRADIADFAEQGALIGNNLAAHIESLEKQMRAAAGDLDFEQAARLRDEIRRLQATELAIANDPLARELALEEQATPSTKRAKKTGKQNKSLFAKPSLDEMGPVMDTGILRPQNTVSPSTRRPRYK